LVTLNDSEQRTYGRYFATKIYPKESSFQQYRPMNSTDKPRDYMPTDAKHGDRYPHSKAKI